MTVRREVVAALPKVELHVHLEGTLSEERIRALAAQFNEPLDAAPGSLFTFSNLSAFLEFLDWSCSMIRSSELLAEVAYDFARRAADDGTVYAEVIVNPVHWRNWDLGDLVESITVGFERAEDEGLAECHILLSILRSQAQSEALDLVEWIGEHRPRRVLGLSIDGNEAVAGRTGPRFAPVFARAAELGIRRVAHAGESSGASGVRDAVELLQVERIDHGVRAVEDETVIDLLIARNVTLDVCLSSNLVHLYPSLEVHPLPILHQRGVRTTLNTDDPGFLGITLTGEFLMAADAYGWQMSDLANATRRAIDAAFCPPATSARLHALVDSYLDELENLP